MWLDIQWNRICYREFITSCIIWVLIGCAMNAPVLEFRNNGGLKCEALSVSEGLWIQNPLRTVSLLEVKFWTNHGTVIWTAQLQWHRLSKHLIELMTQYLVQFLIHKINIVFECMKPLLKVYVESLSLESKVTKRLYSYGKGEFNELEIPNILE